jgi:Basic region leucine zipper
MNSDLALQLPPTFHTHALPLSSVHKKEEHGLDDVDLIFCSLFSSPYLLGNDPLDGLTVTGSPEHTYDYHADGSEHFGVPVSPTSVGDEHTAVEDERTMFDDVRHVLERQSRESVPLFSQIDPVASTNSVFVPVSPTYSNHEQMVFPNQQLESYGVPNPLDHPLQHPAPKLAGVMESLWGASGNFETPNDVRGTKRPLAPSKAASGRRTKKVKREADASATAELMRLRNREHARLSRLRKKRMHTSLQESLEELKAENEKLRACIEKMFGASQTEQLVEDQRLRRSVTIDHFISNLKRPENRILDHDALSLLTQLRKEALENSPIRRNEGSVLDVAFSVVA